MNVVAACVFLILGAISITPAAAVTPALLLTPYILKNQTETARNLSAVNPDLFLNVTSYSGYLTVDEKHNSNLFFWYFPAKEKPVKEDTPWIIWLQGGPGATSLAGVFVEIGPFVYKDSDGSIRLRNSSWHQKYSLLFIDNPVGAGFSFTDSDDGYVRTMDDCSEHLYNAVQQFLELFPEHRRAPLFLAGESYAGHYLPALGDRILHPPALPNLNIKDTTVNLKGIMMGNPVIDRRDEVNLTSAYYQWGLIDPQSVEAVRPLQEKYAKAIRDSDEKAAYDARNDLLDKLESRTMQTQSYNVMKGYIPEISGFEPFVTRSDVREAIHAGSIAFTFSNTTVHVMLQKDFLASLTPKVEELLEHCRVLIYCGQLDLTAPCVLNAEARRRAWRWSGRQAFLAARREPWWHGEAVAGYVKSGGNFTEVLVRNAGHLVPMDKPAEAFELIDFFIRGLDLPLPVNYNEKDNDTPAYVDFYPQTAVPTTPANHGLVASVVLNVVFVAIIVVGAIFWIRWKKRTETYFYSTVENASLNGVLTMD